MQHLVSIYILEIMCWRLRDNTKKFYNSSCDCQQEKNKFSKHRKINSFRGYI